MKALVSPQDFAVITAVSAGFLLLWTLFFRFFSPQKTASGLWLGAAVALGALSTAIAAYLEGFGFDVLGARGVDFSFTYPGEAISSLSNIGASLLFSFFFIALIEELSKIIFLAPLVSKAPAYQVVDGMKAGFFIGLGFAFVENIIYFQNFYEAGGAVFGVIVLRGILSTLAHALYGVVMGYYLAHAKFHYRKWLFTLKALCAAVFMHGFFNFFLMLNQSVFSIGALAILLLLAVFWYEERRNQEITISLRVGEKKIIAPLLLANKDELRAVLSRALRKSV